ncbi:MAG: glucose-1-phosphate adenylyltransferase subunit GlgD [Oscillospiraceae bacterium]|jgi:glucose-1-phosphate adenylyltransferase|nr:glucose-1-phosphate adenylyltransferase subunit GlgD [Oscillospiraceae bacterium]
MKNMHGILFAYSSNVRLKELTEHRTASSIPYGGRYRVIDFMLSNMVNAGITDIGVIMRENYQSLLDHLGSGRDWDLARKRGGLRLLPPFAYAGIRRDASTYRGKLEALYAVTSYIAYIRQEYVVLADGDLIVNLPLEEILERHMKAGADITCVCLDCESGQESDAYLRVGAEGRVSEVLLSGLDENTYPCIGVYLLSKSLLEGILADCAAHSFVNFTRDVLQRMQSRLNIAAYIHKGFSTRPQSVADYFKQSMNLLKPDVRNDLFSRSRPVKTKVRDEASTYYAPESRVKRSIVADGCVIKGELEDCVVFRGVTIDAGARLKNCILMQDTHIERDVDLSFAITDKEVRVTRGRALKGHESYPIAISKGSVV